MAIHRPKGLAQGPLLDRLLDSNKPNFMHPSLLDSPLSVQQFFQSYSHLKGAREVSRSQKLKKIKTCEEHEFHLRQKQAYALGIQQECVVSYYQDLLVRQQKKWLLSQHQDLYKNQQQEWFKRQQYEWLLHQQQVKVLLQQEKKAVTKQSKNSKKTARGAEKSCKSAVQIKPGPNYALQRMNVPPSILPLPPVDWVLSLQNEQHQNMSPQNEQQGENSLPSCESHSCDVGFDQDESSPDISLDTEPPTDTEQLTEPLNLSILPLPPVEWVLSFQNQQRQNMSPKNEQQEENSLPSCESHSWDVGFDQDESSPDISLGTKPLKETINLSILPLPPVKWLLSLQNEHQNISRQNEQQEDAENSLPSCESHSWDVGFDQDESSPDIILDTEPLTEPTKLVLKNGPAEGLANVPAVDEIKVLGVDPPKELQTAQLRVKRNKSRLAVKFDFDKSLF